MDESRFMMLRSVQACRSLWVCFRPVSVPLLATFRRLLNAPNLKLLHVEDPAAVGNERLSPSLEKVVFHLRYEHKDADVWSAWSSVLTDACVVRSVRVIQPCVAVPLP